MNDARSGTRPKILVTFGTRPEAIKMFPVVAALRARDFCDVRVVVTAQHRAMLDQVLELADLHPEIDLDLMQQGQSLDDLAARVVTQFGKVLDTERPDRVLVHGDTLTTMMASTACYFRRIPVGHVEAGLRSGDIYSPWPEEVNRKVTGVIADLHFAPTRRAATALQNEQVAADRIYVTGNTVIDALLDVRNRLTNERELAQEIRALRDRFRGKRIIAVTAHRRENFGDRLRQIAAALRDIATRDDVTLIYPMHPNPEVTDIMRPALAGVQNLVLLDPLDYANFVALLDACDIVLTDSGGIQEEAPAFGKPVLVMRETTERPEGVEAMTAALVGTDRAEIVRTANRLLDDRKSYENMAKAHNPYGDGNASARIAKIIEKNHTV